jgi:hypothetical protein
MICMKINMLCLKVNGIGASPHFSGLRPPRSVLRIAPYCGLIPTYWPFLDEAEAFPFGPHDDQIDALSGAIGDLALGRGEIPDLLTRPPAFMQQSPPPSAS